MLSTRLTLKPKSIANSRNFTVHFTTPSPNWHSQKPLYLAQVKKSKNIRVRNRAHLEWKDSTTKTGSSKARSCRSKQQRAEREGEGAENKRSGDGPWKCLRQKPYRGLPTRSARVAACLARPIDFSSPVVAARFQSIPGGLFQAQKMETWMRFPYLCLP